jgi:hypothetical protein
LLPAVLRALGVFAEIGKYRTPLGLIQRLPALQVSPLDCPVLPRDVCLRWPRNMCRR